MTDGPVFSPHPDDPPAGSDEARRQDAPSGNFPQGHFGIVPVPGDEAFGEDEAHAVFALKPGAPANRNASLSVGFATAAWVVVIILYLVGGIAFIWPGALAVVAIICAVRGYAGSPRMALLGGGSAVLSLVAVVLYFTLVVQAATGVIETGS